jgi:hypothetical protein
VNILAIAGFGPEREGTVIAARFMRRLASSDR